MATLPVRPSGDGSLNQLLIYPASPTTHWDKVDETGTYGDGDSTYLQGRGGTYYGREYFSGNFSSLPAGCTINSVTIYCCAKISSGTGYRTVYFEVYDGTNTVQAGLSNNVTSSSYADYSSAIPTNPSGGSWTRDDLVSGNFEFGIYHPNATIANRYVNITQVWIVVDYTEASSNHPAPTSLQCDRETNPTNASETPVFTALFQATGDSGTATYYQIQVSTVSDFASTVWDSGWQTLATPISDNTRCEEIEYGGSTYLSSMTTYYWRIRFKDASAVESEWSSTVSSATLSGFRRAWDDDEMAFRKKLNWTSDHKEIPQYYTQRFEFETGLRKIIATDGCFDESIQESGGFQIVSHKDRTHVVYMSHTEADKYYGIRVVTFDWATRTWGGSYFIDTTGIKYDIHYFPVLTIDVDGYLHVFYGCHYNQMKYRRSKYPNESGSLLTDDTSGVVWGDPTDSMADDYYGIPGATAATYPVALVEPNEGTHGRVYVFFRYGPFGSAYRYMFNYSDDNGVTWNSTACTIIEDTYYADEDNQRYRVYAYGWRYDTVSSTHRLHIGFSHVHEVGGEVDIRRGIWYMYSDYDETDGSSADVGFNIWRRADGTLLGRTKPSGGSQTPVDYVAANAIMLRDNHQMNLFSTNLVLDKNQNPIVLFAGWWWKDESTGLVANPFSEPALYGAKWNGSSWDIIKISEQINYRMRAARCSIGIQTDKDGIIKGFLPVNARTDFNYIPAVDESHAGAVVKSGSQTYYYECVNQGWEYVDYNATDGLDVNYIDVYYSGALVEKGKVFFSGSESIPSDVIIKSVRVTALVRSTQATAFDIKLGLSNGSTENWGSAQSCNSQLYRRYEEEWATNPFTSSAWAVADFSTLQFGILDDSTNSTYRARVIRIHMAVEVAYSASDEQFGTEILEIYSNDDGATWNVGGWITMNSEKGTPIITAKNDLSNDRIEIVWSSGRNIFYLTDDALNYGLIRSDGKDLKLYYGGTEIHRVVDYIGIATTRISFSIQETIPADSEEAPKDYHAYFGNPHATSQPLSDPNEVYLWCTNFEEYDSGDTVSGVDGLTISADDYDVWESPPADTNRVFAGNRSLELIMNTSGYAAYLRKTLGTTVSNIWVEAGISLEGTQGANATSLEMRFVDGSSNYGGAGIYSLSGTLDEAFYELNGTNHYSSTVMAPAQVMHEIACGITSKGLTAMLNDQYICVEQACITSVDDIYFNATFTATVAEKSAFVDYIRVMQHIETTPTTGDKQNYYDSPTYNYSIEYDSSYTSAYDSAHDGSYEVMTSTRCTKIDIELGVSSSAETSKTAYFYIYVASGAEYDENNVVYSTSYSFASAGTTDTWQYGTKTINNLPPGTYSFKVDFYSWSGSAPTLVTSRINSVTIYDLNEEPSIVLGDLEGRGYYLNAHLKRAGTIIYNVNTYIGQIHYKFKRNIPIDYSCDRSIYGITCIDISKYRSILGVTNIAYIGNLSYSGIFSLEYKGGFSNGYEFPIGYAGVLINTSKFPIEYKGGFSTTNEIGIEYISGFSNTFKSHLEYLNYRDINLKTHIEYSGNLLYSLSFPLEYKGGFSYTGMASIEYCLGVSPKFIVPVEYLKAISYTKNLMVSYPDNLSTSLKTNIEFCKSHEYTGKFDIEYGNILTYSGKFLIECPGGLSYSIVSNIEYRGCLSHTNKMHVEFCRGLLDTYSIPIEYAVAFLYSSKTQIDFTKLIYSRGTSIIEYRGCLSHSNIFPIEYVSNFSNTSEFNVELLNLLSQSNNILIGYKGGLSYTMVFPIEWTAGREFSESSIIPIEYLGGISYTGKSCVSYGKLLNIYKSIPTEYLVNISYTSEVPIEIVSGVSIVTIGVMPIEYLGSFSQSFNTLIEYNIQLQIIKALNIEFNMSRSLTEKFSIEYGKAFMWASYLVMEYLSGLSCTPRMSIEYLADKGFYISLNIENLSGKTIAYSIPIEYVINRSIKLGIPIEWYGTLIAALIIQNISLSISTIIDPAIYVPSISELLMHVAKIDNEEMKKPSLTDAIISVAKVISEELLGGKGNAS